MLRAFPHADKLVDAITKFTYNFFTYKCFYNIIDENSKAWFKTTGDLSDEEMEPIIFLIIITRFKIIMDSIIYFVNSIIFNNTGVVFINLPRKIKLNIFDIYLPSSLVYDKEKKSLHTCSAFYFFRYDSLLQATVKDHIGYLPRKEGSQLLHRKLCLDNFITQAYYYDRMDNSSYRYAPSILIWKARANEGKEK